MGAAEIRIDVAIAGVAIDIHREKPDRDGIAWLRAFNREGTGPVSGLNPADL